MQIEKNQSICWYFINILDTSRLLPQENSVLKKFSTKEWKEESFQFALNAHTTFADEWTSQDVACEKKKNGGERKSETMSREKLRRGEKCIREINYSLLPFHPPQLRGLPQRSDGCLAKLFPHSLFGINSLYLLSSWDEKFVPVLPSRCYPFFFCWEKQKLNKKKLFICCFALK